METDHQSVDPQPVDFQGLRDIQDDNNSTSIRDLQPEFEHIPQVNHAPQSNWDYTQYYNQPMPPNMNRNPYSAFLPDMDKSAYIFMIVAFLVGLFLGRGMVQPVILRN